MTICDNIRQMRPDDIDEVMAIWLQGNLQAHPFVAPAYWHDNAPRVRKAIQEAEVWVCDDSGIQGFIGMVDGYVAGLFVREAARCQGVGTALLDKGKESSESLVLHVYRKNHIAVDFYLHSSFRITSTSVDDATGEEEYEMAWESRVC